MGASQSARCNGKILKFGFHVGLIFNAMAVTCQVAACTSGGQKKNKAGGQKTRLGGLKNSGWGGKKNRGYFMTIFPSDSKIWVGS